MHMDGIILDGDISAIIEFKTYHKMQTSIAGGMPLLALINAKELWLSSIAFSYLSIYLCGMFSLYEQRGGEALFSYNLLMAEALHVGGRNGEEFGIIKIHGKEVVLQKAGH